MLDTSLMQKQAMLVHYYEDNIAILQRRKYGVQYGVDFSLENVKVELSAEEQWKTVNAILSTKGDMIHDLHRIQLSLQQKYGMVNLGMVNHDEMVKAEHMTDDDRIGMVKLLNYVKTIKENGASFDLDECFKYDINSRRLIESMSTSKKMQEALDVSSVLDITKEKILKEIEKQKAKESIKPVSPRDIAEAGKKQEIGKGELNEGGSIIKRMMDWFTKDR